MSSQYLTDREYEMLIGLVKNRLRADYDPEYESLLKKLENNRECDETFREYVDTL